MPRTVPATVTHPRVTTAALPGALHDARRLTPARAAPLNLLIIVTRPFPGSKIDVPRLDAPRVTVPSRLQVQREVRSIVDSRIGWQFDSVEVGADRGQAWRYLFCTYMRCALRHNKAMSWSGRSR